MWCRPVQALCVLPCLCVHMCAGLVVSRRPWFLDVLHPLWLSYSFHLFLSELWEEGFQGDVHCPLLTLDTTALKANPNFHAPNSLNSRDIPVKFTSEVLESEDRVKSATLRFSQKFFPLVWEDHRNQWVRWTAPCRFYSCLLKQHRSSISFCVFKTFKFCWNVLWYFEKPRNIFRYCLVFMKKESHVKVILPDLCLSCTYATCHSKN